MWFCRSSRRRSQIGASLRLLPAAPPSAGGVSLPGSFPPDKTGTGAPARAFGTAPPIRSSAPRRFRSKRPGTAPRPLPALARAPPGPFSAAFRRSRPEAGNPTSKAPFEHSRSCAQILFVPSFGLFSKQLFPFYHAAAHLKTPFGIDASFYINSQIRKQSRKNRGANGRRPCFVLKSISGVYRFKPQTEFVRNHRNKLAVCGFPLGVVNGVAKIGSQNIHVPPVPGDLNRVADRALNAGRGC